jgi:hypothetical protein
MCFDVEGNREFMRGATGWECCGGDFVEDTVPRYGCVLLGSSGRGKRVWE